MTYYFDYKKSKLVPENMLEEDAMSERYAKVSISDDGKHAFGFRLVSNPSEAVYFTFSDEDKRKETFIDEFDDWLKKHSDTQRRPSYWLVPKYYFDEMLEISNKKEKTK